MLNYPLQPLINDNPEVLFISLSGALVHVTALEATDWVHSAAAVPRIVQGEMQGYVVRYLDEDGAHILRDDGYIKIASALKYDKSLPINSLNTEQGVN